MDLSLLTFGDMLSFIGLIIAAISLSRPRYSLIWKLTDGYLKVTSIGLLIIGYMSPVIAVFIPDSSNFWNGLSVHNFIQTSGFIVISLGLLIIAFIFTRFNTRHLLFEYPKFNIRFNKYPKRKWRDINIQLNRQAVLSTRSARKFYYAISLFLMRGHIEEVVEIVRFNCRPLVRAARKFNPYRERFSNEAHDTKVFKVGGSNFAYETMFQLLTDKAIMKHVVTKNRFFIHALVEAEIDMNLNEISNEFAAILYPNLVESLLENTESYLYTHKDNRTGTARFANVSDLLIGSGIVNRENIIPSQLTWHMRNSEVPLDKYVEALLGLTEKMVEEYKIKPGNQILLQNIKSALNEIIGDWGVTRRIAYDDEERKSFKEKRTNSLAYKVYSKIHTSLTINILPRSNDPKQFKTNSSELAAANTKSYYDQDTLIGTLAHKVYELVEDFTVIYHDTENADEMIRHEMISYIDYRPGTAVSKKYQDLLWERLFDKAAIGELEHSPNIKGYYPNILRFIINFIVPFNSIMSESEKPQAERLKKLMDGELKNALLEDRKMTNDRPMLEVLIPDCIQVKIKKSRKTVQYFYINKHGKKQLLDLSPSEIQPVT